MQVQIDTTNTSDDTISSGTAYEFSTGAEAVTDVKKINTSSAWVLSASRVIRATGTSSLTFDYDSTTLTSGDNLYFSDRGVNLGSGARTFATFRVVTPYYSITGVSQGAYNLNDNASILISGVDANQSGLLTGSPYFLQSDFTIGTTPVSLTSSVYSNAATTREVKVGVAQDATHLILGVDYK